jgi:uncharacterized protein (DUF4415 family)
VKVFDPVRAAAHGHSRESWDAVESPELADDELAQARATKDAMPELHAAIVETIARREAGPSDTPIPVRLDADESRATGKRWQPRANAGLRHAKIEEIVGKG